MPTAACTIPHARFPSPSIARFLARARYWIHSKARELSKPASLRISITWQRRRRLQFGRRDHHLAQGDDVHFATGGLDDETLDITGEEKDGKVTGIELISQELGEFDESARRRPSGVPRSAMPVAGCRTPGGGCEKPCLHAVSHANS